MLGKLEAIPPVVSVLREPAEARGLLVRCEIFASLLPVPRTARRIGIAQMWWLVEV